MGKTSIEWTPYVHNIMHGCSPVSEGCANCFAEQIAASRLAGRGGYPPKPNHFDVTLRPEKIDEIYRWRKPRVALVCSMGDLFHPDVPFDFIERAFTTFYSASVDPMTEHVFKHIFLALTKRPERMHEFYIERLVRAGRRWPPNVWAGISAETQKLFVERMKWLSLIPAKQFASFEPLLGPIDLKEPEYNFPTAYDKIAREKGVFRGIEWADPGPDYIGLDWAVFGAETGPNARPMHPAWARGVRDQARAAGVPVLLKSMGDWKDISDIGFAEKGDVWPQYETITIDYGGAIQELLSPPLWKPIRTVPDFVLTEDAKRMWEKLTDRNAAHKKERWVTLQHRGYREGGRRRILDGEILNEFPPEIEAIINAER